MNSPELSPKAGAPYPGAASAAHAPGLWNIAKLVPSSDWLTCGETFAAWISSKKLENGTVAAAYAAVTASAAAGAVDACASAGVAVAAGAAVAA